MKLRSVWFLLLCLTALNAWGRGGGGCFERGTPVLTPNGPVPIEQLKAGDSVWSVQSGRLMTATVQAQFEVEPAEYLELTVAGRTLRVTDEHPFQIAAGVFRAAQSLQPGDTLQLWREGELHTVTLEAIRRIIAEQPAYNLLVSPGGTYLADGVLVHNKGCFLPDTPVLRADQTPIPISTVRPGEKLLAFTLDGKVVTSTVEHVITHRVDEYRIVTTELVQLRVTAEHPFYVGNGTFKTLEALRMGDTIFAYDGQGHLMPQRIIDLEAVHSPTLVYNLQTDSPHTYFASGIAVHNKGGGCFPAGTPIRTPRGEVAIEKLAVSDTVLAVDETGRLVQTLVEARFQTTSPLLMLETEYGTLSTTQEHPLLGDDGEFHAAGSFKAGEKIMTSRKGRLRASRIRSIRQTSDSVAVYNLRVGGPHTYIASGFVVHNKGGGGFGGGGYGGSGGHSEDVGMQLSPPTLSKARWVAAVIGAIIGLFAARKFDGLTFFGLRYLLAAALGAGDAALGMQVANFTIIGGLFTLIPIGIGLLAAYGDSGGRSSDGELDYLYPRARINPKADKTKKLLAFIAKVDDSFALDKLVATAESTFRTLQTCWQSQDYGPMKQLLMPDLYVEHVKQIAGLIRNHEINIIDNLQVLAVDIVNVRHVHKKNDREFTALITASARDYYIDAASRRLIRGDDAPAKFQEFWTFQLQDDRWLLREIEQTGESDILKDENVFEQFTDQGVRTIYAEQADKQSPAGPWLDKATGTKANRTERLLNFLATTDKLWTRQDMLEQARKTFLDVKLAWEAGNLSTEVSAKLFPEVADSFRARLAKEAETQIRHEFRNLCVRKVELILVRNYADNRKDEYTVRITAHAQKIVRRQGQVYSQQDYVTPFEEYWTFGRLDNQWKLKELLPKARGQASIEAENVDEESSPEQLQWYYQQTRAN